MSPTRAVAVAAAVAALITATLLLSGCTENPVIVSGDARSGNTIAEILPSDRSDPIVFAGRLEPGGTTQSSAWLGSVVIVNFWYASCPPCRAEAPDLEALNVKYGPEGVVFIGVNVRDTAPTAQTFADRFGITYPSIMDTGDSEVQLAFAGQIAPNAVPTTIVLDREGRAAARILGRIPSRQTLETLIDNAIAETSR